MKLIITIERPDDEGRRYYNVAWESEGSGEKQDLGWDEMLGQIISLLPPPPKRPLFRTSLPREMREAAQQERTTS